MSTVRLLARNRVLLLFAVSVAFALTSLAPLCEAQTFTTLHSFNGTDGESPYGGLIRDNSGSFYGTTAFGGPFGQGVIFKLDKLGTETTRYAFTGHSDGGYPRASVIRDSMGFMYGTTASGGTLTCNNGRGCGLTFKLDSNGIETALHSFTGEADGRAPNAPLLRDAAGNLYGTALTGGKGRGVVFKLDSLGNETVLYTFAGNTDGGYPYAGLLRDSAGNLYGTTNYGGDLTCNPPLGCGVIFKLDTTGVETVLHEFTGTPDGAFPVAALIQDAIGNFYGTTSTGGTANLGTIFKLDTAGNETVLHSFTGSDGSYPDTSLILDSSGTLYGTAYNGGAAGLGVVFKLDSAGTLTVLHTFAGTADGAHPYANLLLDGRGNLYGTTTLGGSSNHGVVFRIAP
jgi:uncharacterized repeat protein (TIGR03803 family)